MDAKRSFIYNTLFYALILLLIVAFCQFILPILMPFIIGFCVASLLQIPLRKIPFREPKARRTCSLLLCIGFYVLIAWLLYIFGKEIVSQISSFALSLPSLFENQLLPFFLTLADRLKEALVPIDPNLAEMILNVGNSIVQNLGQLATNISASAVKWVANLATALPGLIIEIILTVVSSFYFSADYKVIIKFFKKLIPKTKRNFVLHTLQYAKTAIVVFIRSYSLIFMVTFLELCIGLALMKIPYAVLIALGIAIFDLMPVLGTGGILLPWTVICLFMGNYAMAIKVMVLYLVITAVRNTIEPKIIGAQIGLHPLATLVAMILGLKLIGLLGMIGFPILLVALNNLRKHSHDIEVEAAADDAAQAAKDKAKAEARAAQEAQAAAEAASQETQPEVPAEQSEPAPPTAE